MMLAAVSLTQPRRRFFGRRKRLPAVSAAWQAAGGGKFLHIQAEMGMDGLPDWDGVRRAAGREAGRLLLPHECKPPSGRGIAPFAGVALDRRLMALAGMALLEMLAFNPRLVQVGIYDPQAVLPEMALDFVKLAADVRVVTGREERLQRTQREAMLRYGAVVSVSGDTAALRGSLVLLAPDGLPPGWEEKSAMWGMALTAAGGAHPALAAGENVADGYVPRAPFSLNGVLPPGCEASRFLAGLYELSGVREIGGRPPEFLMAAGKTLSLKDAAWRIVPRIRRLGLDEKTGLCYSN